MKQSALSSFFSEKNPSKIFFSPPSSSFGINWIERSKASFSLYVCLAIQVNLRLYTLNDLNTPFQTIEGVPDQNKISFIVEHLPSSFAYSWQVTRESGPSKEFADPWNPLLASTHLWNGPSRHDRSLGFENLNENLWGDVFENPNTGDLRFYECHVRSASQNHPTHPFPGTFKGLETILDHVKSCGFNVIELLPIQEFEERAVAPFDPSLNSPSQRVNYWGYMPLHPQSIMRAYSTSGQSLDAEAEFRDFIKKAHSQGIKVVLDLVYNHLDALSPMAYCMADELWLVDSFNKLVDYTGCGNTVNCQHPVVRDWIRHQLYYMVYRLGVDGFRFDLACALYRQSDGSCVFEGSLLHQLKQDPWLSDRIWINEPWDAAGAWGLGQSTKWGFHEWNDRYRDDARSFIHFAQRKDLAATRLCGSNDLFKGPNNASSIQYITCHDGFCLKDLVSYNERHNEPNGEFGRDGHQNNLSFNYGVEGETTDPQIIEIRERQILNFMTFLAVSKGPIMLLAGDEYGHTRKGNNNPWCQDNELNALDWKTIFQKPSILLFWQNLMKWRENFSLFQEKKQWSSSEIRWHGLKLNEPNWSDSNGFIAFELLSKESTAFVVFNTGQSLISCEIPNHFWRLVCHSGPISLQQTSLTLGPRSSLILNNN